MFATEPMPENRQHFLTYMRRVLKTPINEEEKPSIDPIRVAVAPAYHTTDDERLAKSIKPGDVFWFVTIIQVGGILLPPSIDAKFVVGSRLKRMDIDGLEDEGSPVGGKKFVFRPQKSSFYLPWCSAVKILEEFEFETAGGGPGAPLPKEIGHEDESWRNWPYRLQRSRKLSKNDALLIEDWADRVRERTAFVSYSWADGAPLAAELAKLVSNLGASVWIDHFCMPRRISRGLAFAPNKKLEGYLESVVSQASGFLAIRTPGWSREGSWCERELGWAIKHKRPGSGITMTFEGQKSRNDVASDQDVLKLASLANQFAEIAVRRNTSL